MYEPSAKWGGVTSDLGVSVEADILSTFAAVDDLDVLEEVDGVESVAGRVEGDLSRPTLLQLGIKQGPEIKGKPLRYGLIYHNEGEISQYQQKRTIINLSNMCVEVEYISLLYLREIFFFFKVHDFVYCSCRTLYHS